jgi:hypothetical protein
MRRPVRTRSVRPPKAKRQALPASLRDRLAMLLVVVTVAGLALAFFLSKDTQFRQFLMPGPLASAHGTIENCNACHSKSGSGKLTWLHGLIAGDPLADSKACLTCHRMPDTAFNAHNVAVDVLEQSTKRLMKIAAKTPAPPSARAQSSAFPATDKVANGLYCATCHQEHQGVNFKLNKISNEQCRSCHVVKFDSFDGHHPEFGNYPFKRRSRIIYDHAGHFGKHFPELAKKDPSRRIPATCSTCHDSRKDKRVMAVAPFEQTCATCHLDQIVGKERVSGPKGIAFLTLPGLDLQTLKKKKASIGEWPEASEAELTPFMKVMISRNERGRALIKTVDRLNLQDLSRANNAQIRAVTGLVWEIKRLFYVLITGKASDVLADLNVGGSEKLSANLISDLIASIPRDVVVSAQQQWLPNLGTEMANRQDAARTDKPGSPAQTDQQTPAKSAPGAKAAVAEPETAVPQAPAAATKTEGGRQTAADKSPPNRAADQTDDLLHPTEEELRGTARPGGAAVRGFTAYADKETASANEPRAVSAGSKNGEKVAQAKAADQTDDLLNPTEDELRGVAAPKGGKAAQPGGAARKPDTANAKPDSAAPADAAPKAGAEAPADAPVDAPVAAARTRAAPAISIESDVEPENWAEYGGWYRQDYAIFYRPTGHKDKFIYSWLFLTGPQAPKGDKKPAAAVFDFLTSKDAQGSCTKCHSVDDIQGRGRVVNFSPPKVETKQGRFTNFVHEPHFGVLESRGCLTCHNIEKGRPYLQSYEQGNPQTFVSNFGAVKKELCQSCHTSNMARQDCLLCHKYHVNGVTTPIMNTRIPIQ